MLTPVSLIATMADFLILPWFDNNSCRYFAKKWIVSSIEIPKAILKTKIVEGLIGIPTKPIIADVIINGNKLGTMETITILYDLNKKDIKIDITQTAIIKLINKFFTK